MRGILAVAAALLALPALAQTTTAPTLPGGASALNEAHGAWSVTCEIIETAKNCGFSQALRNRQSGTTVLAVELTAPGTDRAEGMLLTAFGLRLADGIGLTVDGKPIGAKLAFLTCVQTGCLVPLAFDQTVLTTLKAGAALEVTGTRVDDGQPVTLTLSLSGFTAAYNRTAELGS